MISFEHGIRFWVNDREIWASGLSINTTLLNFLRENLKQTGTKEGCAEGDCGACTVVVQRWKQNGEPVYRSMNSCLVPLISMNGLRLYTVEGLKQKGLHHPVQDAMVESLGSQCGYCTPGFVMSLFEGYYRDDIKDEWQKEDQICGNLCRCTGYRPIRDALNETIGQSTQDHFTQVLQAPPQERATSYQFNNEHFFLPTTLAQLWEALQAQPNASIVSGATDLGLEITKKKVRYPALISLEAITELQLIQEEGNAWRIGSGVPLSDVELFSQSNIPSLARMLRYFGARQIKNRATLGGNICTASPIGDTPPALIALNATFIVQSPTQTREIPAKDFFLSYRKTALQEQEILVAVRIPKTQPHAITASYKVSKRRELDISAVSMSVHLVHDTHIRELRVAYGGMAAIPKRASMLEEALIGKEWNKENVYQALSLLPKEFTPMTDHRGTAWYRMQLARNLFLGFFLETQQNPSMKLKARHSSTLILEGRHESTI